MAQWFEKTNQYTIGDALGERQWPTTLSLVRVNPVNGKTQWGWGKKDFASNYKRGAFTPSKALSGFETKGTPFGIVTRSLPGLCVDIDGKNGGIQASRILDLDPTLAETSKSGNGFHVFYRVPEAVWSPEFGYAEFGDVNGLIPGVDIRGVGIVYHYPQQRWNNLDLAPLPDSIRVLMEHRAAEREAERIKKEILLDPEELAIARSRAVDAIIGKVIPKGRRNNTLFALGARALELEVPEWETVLQWRALMLGLEPAEISEIISNIKRYT